MTGGPWTRSMKVVHRPGPKWGSMDPWSMFCPHPFELARVRVSEGSSYRESTVWCFYDMKRRTRPLCSLQQESRKTFLDGGQVWMRDAGDLSVSFDLLGFYLPISITSSLR